MFEWDEAKSETNPRARRFDITHAALIFAGPTFVMHDEQANFGEWRILAIDCDPEAVMRALAT